MLIQYQRRAIESLRQFVDAEPLPPQVASLPLALDDGASLHILGVSVGIGSCSGIKGMDILVLADDRPEGGIQNDHGVSIENSAYAVLLRECTREELEEERGGDDTPRDHAELLRVTDITSERVVFSRTGHTVVYIAGMYHR